jgi:glycosyltransferase involved in cell wall biosynthesis
MGWVVDDGVNGMHVPPENAGALADSIRKLQQNRVKILRLGENGRQKFDRQFHIDKSAAGVSELYKSVLENIPASQQQAKP